MAEQLSTTGSERGLSDLVSGILNDGQELLKQQLNLFKAEVKSDFEKTREASIPLFIGIGVGLNGALLLSFMLVYLLQWLFPNVPLFCWFGLVGILGVGGGWALFHAGKTKMASFNPLPDQSAQALKENVQWIMNPK
jgi:hypothetical protein